MCYLVAVLFAGLLAITASTQTTDPFADVKKAAEAGDPAAQFRLGIAYRDSDVGIPQSDTDACRWFLRAANAGYAPAQMEVGTCYQSGLGLARDFGQAAAWYRKAADQGSAGAQFNLGQMYHYGRGVKQDDKEALGWFQKAAAQGNGGAEYRLGEMYERGIGVAKDVAIALQHYQVAADRIQPAAFLKLATMSEEGVGMARDLTEAYKWYSLFIPFSGDKDPEYRAHRDALAAKMTSEQIADAERRADDWAQAHKKRRPHGAPQIR